MNSHSPIKVTIRSVMPAVVSIAIKKTLEALEKEIPADMLPFVPLEKGHLKIPQEMIDNKGMINIGGGSGFIVTKSGIIVTNKHVVADKNAEYTAILNDGKKYETEILARDPVDDVAILQIKNASALPTLPLGDSSVIDLGEEVLAFGNALGLFKNTVSRGIVSGLSRTIRAATEMDPKANAPLQELRGLIQTDAAINPGNSGGPLVTLDGKAIAINTAIVYGAQNLGFAIPINAVKRDLADLEKHGRIRRPLLGLHYLMIDEGLQRKMHLSQETGALVLGHLHHFPAVIPGSPAEKAGLKPKDIVLKVDGEFVTAERTIQDFLEEREVGDTISLTVARGSRMKEMKVKLAERK